MEASVRRHGGVLLCALTLLATTAWADAGWVATKTRALPLQLSVATTPVAATMPLRIAVALKTRHSAELDQFIHEQHRAGSPLYGATLTPAQFRDTYAPSLAQAQAVAAYLRDNGFTKVRIADNRMLVTGEGNAAAAQKAFNTTIVRFRNADGVRMYAPSRDVMVPESLAGTVLSVMGLQYVPHRHLATTRRLHDDEFRKNYVPAAGPGVPVVAEAYTPDQTRSAYNANGVVSGANTIIAISSSNSDLSQVVADLRQFEAEFNLPQVPVQIVNFGPQDQPDANADGEWDLDSQSASGIAFNLKKIIFYNATDLNDEPTMLAAINQFAADGVAKAGNMSYGGCENIDLLSGAEDAFDQAYKQAIVQGQTWFASSGDAGAACSVLINMVTPDFGIPSTVETPAASAYVVAVGGTSLFINDDGSYNNEIAWDAGGGGTSKYIFAPEWQLNDAAVLSAWTTTLRAVPDISMVAGGPDVGTPIGWVGFGGAAIVAGGADAAAVGTSWSSPLAVGAWARLQSSRCNAMGFAAPLFYALDPDQVPTSTAVGFRDILLGNNGQYEATPGWDNTTGYGSFDVGALDAALPPRAAGCDPFVAAPVATLSASAAVGPAPLAVVFDGNGSTDPASLPLTYSMDFGDGTTASQSSPVFAPHVYANSGTYTAKLTVVNDKGGVSPTVSRTITAFGTPASCAPGGVTVLTSPPGDAQLQGGVDIGQGTDDLLWTSYAEPGDLSNKLVIKIKVANLASVKPGFRWVSYFDVAGRTEPNDDYYFVAMSSADGPAPTFIYGTHGYVPGPEPVSTYNRLGTLDGSSTYTADGLITLVLDKSVFNLQPGDVLTGLYTSIRTQTPDDPSGTVAGGAGLTQDSAGTAQPYRVVGNAACAANTAPVAALQVAAGGAPLAFAFDAGGSTDAEDAIAYSRFDFGDGSPSAWQTGTSATHVYANPGNYTATVTVADARGLISASAAQAPVQAFGPDVDPDAFSFPDALGTLTGAWTKSATVTITGIASPAPIAVVDGQYSIDGGAFSNQPGFITNGQTVAVRHKAADTATTATDTLLTIGSVSATFHSVTGSADRTPDPIEFYTVVRVNPGVLIESNVVTPTGFDTRTPVVPGTGIEYRIDGGAWTTVPGRLLPGHSLQVRLMSSTVAGAVSRGTINVGGQLARFVVRTQ